MDKLTRLPLTKDELECIVDLTERLVKLRQNECKHLCIENTGPEIYGKLIAVHYQRGMPLLFEEPDPDYEKILKRYVTKNTFSGADDE